MTCYTHDNEMGMHSAVQDLTVNEYKRTVIRVSVFDQCSLVNVLSIGYL